ncbi:hypothetical protein AB5I41_24285 [Sphingomonas sp. MMS24-JH45]
MRAKARVVAALGEVPGVAVREVSEGVVIEGRGLVRRLLADARLRHVAGLVGAGWRR